ncbi:molybdopterin oxidoreductase family protein [Candidatus Halobonum tyrrellensis]|uniref:Molybdopterin oxidoreductase n=1 Tax=Candidatus Halobonum tyrrellensis G22 TaxID=1324957 RepID=V4J021_9EURY|nr:molybdopterin-dependent oxidoreductase [Candidatus Halobonum tyrrellensis]ESP88777.1 molybdopterin oxidoreductase [Candidatus Halobonum tyrrellensis G22]
MSDHASAPDSDPDPASAASGSTPERGADPDARGTVCPLCGVGCRLEPGEDRERARGVAGPSNPNGRLCGKGVGAFDAFDDGERLTRPRVRRDGDLVPVAWAEAYERVADGFGGVVEAAGPDALAFLGAPHCTTEENYLLGKLARTLGTNNVDNRARLCHDGTTRALSERLGRPATTNGLDELDETDVILVAGANPAERQPVAFDSFVRPAVNDGATLVHVDPVGNATTRLADVHLAPRPDTDALVFDLLSAGVAEAGGVDGAFVDGRTTGYDGFEADLAELDRGAGTARAGVDPEALDRVVGAVADADRVAAMVGTGVEGAGGEGDASAADALVNLLLLTGNVGRPGTGLYVLRGLVNEQGATDAGCVPDRLPGHGRVTDPDARARVAAEWGVDPPAEPGLPADDLLAAFGDGVRGALVVGENPAVSKRDDAWLRRRLDALDTLVVVDVVDTETTRHADVVLPAAAGVEKAGTVTNLERRVQRLRPTADPPGDARPDFAVLRDLGRLLCEAGENLFDYASPGAVFDELARVAPTHAGVGYDGLDAGGRRWPFDSEGGTLYRESFETADGRAAFGSVQPTPAFDPGAPDSGAASGSADSESSADGDSAGRLRLVTGGRTSGFHGETGADRTLRLHPADAADRGVDAGDPVVVSTAAAAVEAVADPDDGVRRGTAYLHAAVADPLVRTDGSTVAVAATGRTAGEADESESDSDEPGSDGTSGDGAGDEGSERGSETEGDSARS